MAVYYIKLRHHRSANFRNAPPILALLPKYSGVVLASMRRPRSSRDGAHDERHHPFPIKEAALDLYNV